MDILLAIMVGFLFLLAGTMSWVVWQMSVVDDDGEKGIKIFSHKEFPVHLETQVSVLNNIDIARYGFS
jgi:hypothetical protein